MREPRIFDSSIRLLQRVARLDEESGPCGRQRDATLCALEERYAKLCLQLLDLLAQWRLRDVQTLRGAAEMQGLGDGDEVSEVPQIQFAQASYLRPINRV